LTTLAGTWAPERSNIAPLPSRTWPATAGNTTARVIPSTRVTGMTAESPLKPSTTSNAALNSLSVVD